MKPSHAGCLAGLTVASGAGVLAGPPPLAVTGGLLLALLLPGFAVTELVLRGRKLARVERVVLAPALSLAVLALAGLVIYVSGFRLDRIAWTSATAGVTLVALLGATIPKRWAAVGGRVLKYLVDEDEDGTPAKEPAAAVAAGSTPAVKQTPVVLPARGKDDTLVLPAVVLAEQAPAKVAQKKVKAAAATAPVWPPRRLVWQAAPLVLVLAILGGASWLSYDSSRDSYQTAVTALSAEPSGPVNSAGTRGVSVTVTGLIAADGPYSLVASGTTASATVRRTITVPAGGTWTQSLTLPGTERITVTLSRAGDTSAYRTLYISPVE